MNKNERIVYSLSVQDLQDVAEEYLGRKLSGKEVAGVEKNLWRYLDWNESIQFAIDHYLQQVEREKETTSTALP